MHVAAVGDIRVSAALAGGSPDAARVLGLSVTVNLVRCWNRTEELEPRGGLEVFPIQGLHSKVP